MKKPRKRHDIHLTPRVGRDYAQDRRNVRGGVQASDLHEDVRSLCGRHGVAIERTGIVESKEPREIEDQERHVQVT